MTTTALSIQLCDLCQGWTKWVRQRHDITTDTALRSARLFNTIPKFWLNLQTSLDLKQTEIAVGDKIINQINSMQMPA